MKTNKGRKRSLSVWKEPEWTKIDPNSKDYNHNVWKAHFYVTQEMDTKELKKNLVSYAKSKLNFDTVSLKRLNVTSDRELEIPAKWLLIEEKGGKLADHEKKSALSILAAIIGDKDENTAIEEKPKKVTVDIQSAMWNQIEPIVSELDIAIDNDDFSVSPYRLIASNENCKATHCRLIFNYFQKEYELEKDECSPALKAFLEQILIDCDTFIKQNKTERKVRKRKPQSNDKKVAKVKFQPKEVELGLVSVLPADCVEKSIVWFYDTAKRLLGFYEVDEMFTGLDFKGTTIQNNGRSGAKLLRKPEVTLKGIQKLPKTKLKKLYDELTTKEKALTGRFNDNTLILKAF